MIRRNPAIEDREFSYGTRELLVCAAAIALTAMAVPSEAPPTTDTDSAPAAVLPEFTINTDPSFNGLGEVPAMRWSSWAEIHMDVSADRLIEQAETLVSSDLAAAGYGYVNVDPGWMLTTGHIRRSPPRPSGSGRHSSSSRGRRCICRSRHQRTRGSSTPAPMPRWQNGRRRDLAR